MVSKRDKSRKAVVEDKIESPTPEPQINIEELLNKVTLTVVDRLKPDIDNLKVTTEQQIKSITEQLRDQITNEMKDLRSHLPQPQQAPTENYTVPPINNPQPMPQQDGTQQPPQQPMPSIMGMPPELVNILAQLVMRIVAPPNPMNTTNAMNNTFQQATIRKSMANGVFDDWFMQMWKQKIAKEMLGMEIPPEVKRAEEEYMKPLRDVGVNALKRDELEKMHKPQNEEQQ